MADDNTKKYITLDNLAYFLEKLRKELCGDETGDQAQSGSVSEEGKE